MADKPTDSQTNYEVISQDNGKTELRRTIAHLPSYYRTDSKCKWGR